MIVGLINDAIRSVTGDGVHHAHPPYLPGGSVAIRGIDLTAYGHVTEFERAIAGIMGFEHCIACVNGTVALQCALHAELGDKRRARVVVCGMTFAATAAAVVHAGHIPEFVDCDPAGGLDPVALARHIEKHGAPACVIVTHLLGRPANLPAILKIARVEGFPVIEDASQALGAFIPGPRGNLATLSFNLNKIVTTGGGGAILTDSGQRAESLRHLCTTARIPHPWEIAHDAVGWNYRMPPANAMLGNAQLERFPEIVDAKAALAHAYFKTFHGIPEVTPAEPSSRWNNWLNTIEISDRLVPERTSIFEALHRDGLQVRALFTPLTSLLPYCTCVSDGLPQAVRLWQKTICLPSSIALGKKWLSRSRA